MLLFEVSTGSLFGKSNDIGCHTAKLNAISNLFCCASINTDMATFIEKILPWRRSTNLTQNDAGAPVEKSGWSSGFPIGALSTTFGSVTNNFGVAVTPTGNLQSAVVHARQKIPKISSCAVLDGSLVEGERHEE